MSAQAVKTCLFVAVSFTICSAAAALRHSIAQPAPAAASAGPFECGKPGGPCGRSIPEGVKCDKGPGWCQPGHYCGLERGGSVDSTGSLASKCLPVPKDCGKLGHPCCPSNTDSPNTSEDDKMKRRAFCRDGSTCFFFWKSYLVAKQDMYAGNEGSYSCVHVAKDCGTGPGSPCCPRPYQELTNPPLERQGCPDEKHDNSNNPADRWKGQYCKYSPENDKRPQHMQAYSPGVCVQNDPDCGKYGKPCCIFQANSSSGSKCEGEDGKSGYCDGANVCRPCPKTVHESTKDTNYPMYIYCKRY